MKPFRKVLVANRGEIAVRVIRGLRELGIRSAVIYSDADRQGLPVMLADEAYRIGPAPSRESYLRAGAIVELAAEIEADAIHPGYGFLAENADFARRCREAEIKFIGPSPEAIAEMGSKIESRRMMIEAGVPVVPGGQDILPTLEEAAAFADELGYPVLLKAIAGGGGKGMRVVRSAEELPGAYRAARSESAASFGEDSVYLEKFIEEPRHVEIQILGDEHGRVVSLGERECSLQRRHQKVVEEAPSPVVDRELRRQMGEAAVTAAQAAGYTNAGTVEFLLDQDGEFYFLEMNTRLQVEHPVTESASLCRRPLPRICPLAGPDRAIALAGRTGCAQRLWCLRRLRGPHSLRPHVGQAHRLGAEPGGGDGSTGAGTGRDTHRGHPYHGAVVCRLAGGSRFSRRQTGHRHAGSQALSR
jgi:acetyl-CoA carboxylase biotin carboxylase subunit